tara:strand:- start:7069 stop:7647 length:579 start_codon:yes stop_codon:yes gene_type:complete
LKNDKSDKHAATSATSATQEAGLTSLLGVPIEPDDPLAFVGLGLGATQRARDLVLKGLEFEQQLELQKFIESEISRLDAEIAAVAEPRADLDELLGARTSGRGRPSKGWLTIDVKRAGAVLGADDLYRDKRGKSFSRQIDAINFAIEIEKVLFENGHLKARLFDPMTTTKRFQDSVSAGLQELPEHSGRFLK